MHIYSIVITFIVCLFTFNCYNDIIKVLLLVNILLLTHISGLLFYSFVIDYHFPIVLYMYAMIYFERILLNIISNLLIKSDTFPKTTLFILPVYLLRLT